MQQQGEDIDFVDYSQRMLKYKNIFCLCIVKRKIIEVSKQFVKFYNKFSIFIKKLFSDIDKL